MAEVEFEYDIVERTRSRTIFTGKLSPEGLTHYTTRTLLEKISKGSPFGGECTINPDGSFHGHWYTD